MFHRRFQEYSPEHCTPCLKVKYFPDWTHGAYEKLYVYIGDDVSDFFVRDAIKKGKFSLRLSREH